MDLKKYDELRKKINTKDFEGSNRGLDKWLWRFSFVGNASAIFFAYFLVYPALLKTITLHFLSGFWGSAFAILLTIIFLTIFEITKRYLIKNFSSDYFTNHKKLNTKIISWLTTAIAIIVLSFYLSTSGAKNLATTSVFKNTTAEEQTSTQTDSLSLIYENRKAVYVKDNEALRKVNNDLRQKLAETPVNYITVRKDYQTNIDKNANIIENNQAEINKIDTQLNTRLIELNNQLSTSKLTNKTEDTKNILLFVIIVCFNELIIIAGIYFREYFEHTLFKLNQQKFEKIYQKKDRYRALLTFIYGNGKLLVGDKVMGGLELKEHVADKANIANSNKLVDEFLQDMDRIGIFTTNGKRRYVGVTYQEALDILEKFDDAFRILETMK
jgi:hypothetical protein